MQPTPIASLRRDVRSPVLIKSCSYALSVPAQLRFVNSSRGLLQHTHHLPIGSRAMTDTRHTEFSHALGRWCGGHHHDVDRKRARFAQPLHQPFICQSRNEESAGACLGVSKCPLQCFVDQPVVMLFRSGFQENVRSGIDEPHYDRVLEFVLQRNLLPP